MTTEAQINANRANAQKSTGPRTAEGKAKVAHNALKHGLLAREAVVGREDLDKFELFRSELRAELAPVGIVEALLAERTVGLFWRLQRAERFHTEAFDTLYVQHALDPQVKRELPLAGPHRGDPVFGLTVVRDFSQTKVLERLLGYERRMESSLYRTMAELHKLVLLRQAEGSKAGPTAEVGPVSGTGIWPVDPDHGRDAHATVRTNVPGAQEPACETNPMGGLVIAKTAAEATPPSDTGILPLIPSQGQDGAPKRDLLRLGTPAQTMETPGVATDVPGSPEPVCETKPISHGPGVQGSGIGSLTPDPRPLPSGPSCETKPISTRRIRDGEGYRPNFRRRR